MASHRMWTGVILVRAAVTAMLALAAYSATAAQATPEMRPVTLRAHGVPLLKAVRLVCSQAQCRFWFDPGAADRLVYADGGTELPVSPDIRRAPLKQAIMSLLRQADLIGGITFQIHSDRQGATAGNVVFTKDDDLMDRPVTAKFSMTPLIDALRPVCDQADYDYAFDLAQFEHAPVSAAFDGIPFNKCVPALLTAAGASKSLACELYRGVAIVDRLGPVKDDKLPSPVNPLGDMVTVKCERQNAYTLAYAILCATGTYFTLSEDFKLRETAIALDHLTVRQAIEAFGRVIRTPLSIKYDGGVIVVSPKHPRPPTGCPPPHPGDADGG